MKLTDTQIEYLKNEIVSTLSYPYDLDNPEDRKEIANEIINLVNYALTGK